MSGPELAAVLTPGIVFSVVLLLYLYIERDIKRKIQAQNAARERRREESRVYWSARIREAEAAQQAREILVAPLPAAAHNPVRRRILPLD